MKILEELVEEVQVAAECLEPLKAVSADQAEFAAAGNPCYDALQPQPHGLRWQWHAPKQLPPCEAALDLGLVLRTAAFAQSQSGDALAHCQLLSETMRTLRKQIATDDHALYVYTGLLHRLARLFNNTNCRQRAYYSNTESSNLLSEYVQALVLLAQRLYNAAETLPDGEEKARALDESTAAMHEACRVTQYALGEHYPAERRQRWQFQQPPRALSPDTLTQPAAQLEALHERDTEQLRAQLLQEMGGPAQLEAHRLLMRLQGDELKAHRLEAYVGTDLAAHSELIYSALGPVTESVLRDYRAITACLQAQHARSELAQYAARMTLYWQTRQQYWLAASDFAVYEAAAVENALDYGKRAWRRLDRLDALAESEQALVQALYDRVELEMRDQYGAGGALELGELAPVQGEATPLEFKVYANQQWRRLATRSGTAVQDALHGLRALLQQRQAAPLDVLTGQPQQPVGTSYSGNTSEAALSNASKAAVLADRQRHLEWLLGMLVEDGGIYIPPAEVSALRTQQQTVQAVIQYNKEFY